MPDEIVLGTTEVGPFSIDPSTLTKHGIVFGTTGAGKTVLCKVIVEELAVRRIPVLAIDPKGDIGALAIKSKSFSFRPFSDREAEAKRIPSDAYARRVQELYSTRLTAAGVSNDEIDRFVSDVRVRIYTPRSGAGIPISLSPNLDAPKDFPSMLQTDPTLAYEVLELTASTLLKLVGYSGEERIHLSFVSEILKTYWLQGKSVTLELLVDNVVRPPFERLGRIPADEIFGRKERLDFNSRMNLLLTDPAMQSWFIGEEIDFDQWFGVEEPSVKVVDLRGIASEVEKQAFVEYLLQKLFLWLIRQEGVQALRYLLYFDEIYGFCPPVASPPSKKILLRLIKMARAYGLGLLLATQNPSDVDYKVISNANIRCIGRLPTKQDIEHVRTGLDLSPELYSRIPSLAPGQFLVQLFDRGESSIVTPRWLMSYHRGPLDYDEIRLLMGRSEKDNPPPRTGDGSEAIEKSRIVSVDNALPVNCSPRDFQTGPIVGADSRLVRAILLFNGLYTTEFSVDYVRSFTHFNKTKRIEGEGRVAVSHDGRVVDFEQKGSNSARSGKDPGLRYTIEFGGRTTLLTPTFPGPLSLVGRFEPRREDVRLESEEEVEIAPPAEGWKEFPRNGVAEFVSRVYRSTVVLQGVRTTRTEEVAPSTRSIKFRNTERLYAGNWRLTYEVKIGPNTSEVVQFVDATTASVVAQMGVPSCPGEGGSSHEIALAEGEAILRECAHVTCKRHQRPCATCGGSAYCLNCSRAANCAGDHSFCTRHALTCAVGGQELACPICYANRCAHCTCQEHRDACSNCHEYYCTRCLQRKGLLSRARICPNCKR